MNQRADLLAVHHLLQITHHIHVEDIDRQVVVLTHADGCQVHHLQTTCQHLLVGDLTSNFVAVGSFSGSAV